METNSQRAAPSKCTHCDHSMVTPIVCDFCHTLNPSAMGTDYFTLLGLPRRYDLDPAELHRRYIALNREAHPDFHQAQSPEVQELSMKLASALNEAYRTLKDPSRRAEYLLELLGGKSSAQDKSVPQDFLGTIMMMQEELQDAKAAGNAAELQRLAAVLKTQQEGLLKRVAGVFGEFEEAAACEAVRKDLLDELRKQLNAVSYVRKLLSLC